MKGLLLAGGSGTRLNPVTLSVNKHLLPIFNKPMIFYPLSNLLLAGVKEIALVTSRSAILDFKKLLGDGSKFGVRIEYFIQDEPLGIPAAMTSTEDFAKDDQIIVALGDNIAIGANLGRALRSHNSHSGAVIFTTNANDPTQYGILESNAEGIPIRVHEKPKVSVGNKAIIGLYVFDSSWNSKIQELKPSMRGEYEIVDLIERYLGEKALKVIDLGRGSVWFDTGTFENLFLASEYVRLIENRHQESIGDPFQIAVDSGWLNL